LVIDVPTLLVAWQALEGKHAWRWGLDLELA
jgi:hypothetical protein